MSNFQNALNPAQLNPALLQAMATAQQQSGGNNNGGNANAAFQQFHQAFQRLQSQESQKLEQQRLGLGGPQQTGPSQQQQFLQMMQQAGMMGQNGQINLPQGGQNGGMNFMEDMNADQGQGMNQGLAGINMAAIQNGMNIHSQQQGLNLPGMPENEAGRRQMLQNMLSQQLTNVPQQPTPPQFNQALPQQFQQPPQQQQGGPQQQPTINLSSTRPGSEQLREFIKAHPEAVQQMQKRHGPNGHAAIIQELQSIVAAQGHNGPPQQQQPRQSSMGLTGMNPQQQQQQQQQQMNQSYVQPQQMQQVQPSPQPPQHQRMPSADAFQFQTLQNMQGMQPQGQMHIDPKQMEALQAMKAAQQRGGLVTPQMSANNSLPLVSPQPQQPLQHINLEQITPQAQPQQTQNQPPLPRHVSQPQSGQMQPPPPQPPRTLSQTQGLSQQQQQQQQQQQAQQQQQQMQGQGQQNQGGRSSGADVQNMIQGWGDNQLLKSTSAVVSKLVQQAQSGLPQPADPTKFHLLQIIAEWKRRNKEPPPQALQIAGQALGNPQLIQQFANADWATLSNFAKSRVDALSALQRAHIPDSSQNGRQNGGAGSQANPIDMITPILTSTPQLPIQNTVPGSAFQTPQNQISLQPAAQITETPRQQQQQQQQQQMPRPQSQQQQQIPLQPDAQQQQWQQQQQQQQDQQQQLDQQQLAQHAGQTSVPAPAPAKTKPWASMDFRSEPIPLKEDQFWGYLGQIHSKGGPLSPPEIDGKQVNMYLLFSLVHKNGGGAKFGNNPQMWAFIGGYLGFGTDQTQPGQPSRSSPHIANQLRLLYGQYLQPLEDMFYQKLYKDRLKAVATQVQTPQPLQPQLPQQPPQSQPMQSGAAAAQGMSAQFLEAVAKVPGTSLTDQQKKLLEEARRQSQSSQAGPTPGQMPTPGSQQQGNVPLKLSPQLGPATPRTAQAAALKSNPTMIFSWIRTREEGMKAKFPKDFRILSEDDKPRFLSEIRALLPSAKEAQEKTPRFLAIALDGSKEDIGTVLTLISMYMFIFIAVQHAESGRFPFSLPDLAKLRDPLHKTLFKLNNVYKQIASTPEGQAHLNRLFANLDAAAAAAPPSTMPPPSTLPNPDDIASKLPKGLRVEDLKPPPAKRQKGKSGASPASAGIHTPDGNAADSPANPDSATKKGASKRKRQHSVGGKAAAQLVAEARGDLSSQGGVSRNGEPAKDNALGINLDVVETEIQQHASFFDTYNALRGDDESYGQDVWAALTSALDELNDTTTNSTAAIDVNNALASAVGEDELFEEFIDVSKVDDGPTPHWTLPTPELFRFNSREDETFESDTSPESIKTVGSTTGVSLGKTPATMLADHTEEKDNLTAILGGMGSPEARAYNGVVFGGWEDETFDFGVTTV